MLGLTQNQRGLLMVVVAMVLFVSNDAAMKLAAGYMPLTQTVFLRGLFAAMLMLGILAAFRQMGTIPTAWNWLVLIRGVLEIVGSFMFQGALLMMPIGDATAIVQLAPLLLLAFAALVLREKVSFARLIAIVIGFAGAVLVAAPSGTMSFGALLAFGTALVVVSRDLLSRHIGYSISPLVVTFATNVIVSLAALVAPAGQAWTMPNVPALALALTAGLCIGGGYLAMTYAMIWGRVQQLAPFYYSQTIIAIFYSIVLFDDLPSLPALTGIALILAAGLYAAWPERPGEVAVT